MGLSFRLARQQDLGAIRDLQVDSWRRTYAGLLPESFLQADVIAVLKERWAELPGPDWRVDTAWDEESVVGFISVDSAHIGGPYIDNLHVKSAARGGGAGRALMARAMDWLLQRDAQDLWLTVICENHEAREFYRRMGGIEGDARQEQLFGHTVTTRPVHWPDLTVLKTVPDRW